MIKIIKPEEKYLNSYAEAMDEGFLNMSLGGFGNFSSQEIRDNPKKVIQTLLSTEPRQVKTHDGNEFTLYKHEILWIVDDERFIGAISIRLDDNPVLLSFAGHLGLAIRPSLLMA